MPIVPINGQLVTPGDTVVAPSLGGDPQVVLSLAGNFSGATFIVEAVPQGQGAGTWIPIAEVRTDTGQLVSGQIGPINGGGAGGGITLRADGGPYFAMRIRLIALGSGAITAGIATLPFPFASSIMAITGTVVVTGPSGAPVVTGPQPVGPAGLPVPMTAEIGDGTFVQDRQQRAWLEIIHDDLKKLFLLALYFASGGLGTGESPFEFLSAMGMEINPLDYGEMDYLSPMQDR